MGFKTKIYVPNDNSDASAKYYIENGSYNVMADPKFNFDKSKYSYLKGEFTTFFSDTVLNEVEAICTDTTAFNIDGKNNLNEALEILKADIDKIVNGLSDLSDTFDTKVDNSKIEVTNNAKLQGVDVDEEGPYYE